MTLEELSSYLLVNSNQYFVGSDIEVDDVILKQLVRRALSVYGNYRPLSFNEFIEVSRSFILKELNNRKIIEIAAVRYMDPIYNDKEIELNWQWNRDTRLFECQTSGRFNIDVFAMPELEDIDYDQFEFLDLVQGLYLMYIGSSRKAFQMGDLPFENDGADLYSDGKELYENTIEKLSEVNSSWYLSVY